MIRPYDLDRHVAVVRERAARSKQSPAKPGQLQLFDKRLLAPRPPQRYRTSDGLVVDDEDLFSRSVTSHSAKKAKIAEAYASIVGTAMGPKPRPLWWVELFAGPGRLHDRDHDVFLPGSPLEALGIPRPFRGYVFSDLSLPCVECLRRRVGDRAHVLQANANDPDLHSEIRKIVPAHALVVLYCDPEGLDLEWSTLKYFIDRYNHLDLLLNLPVSGVVRAVAAGYERKAAAMLDHDHPSELTDDTTGTKVRDWFHRHLANEGFDQIHTCPVMITGTRREIYDIMLASRHPLAKRFFSAAEAAAARAA